MKIVLVVLLGLAVLACQQESNPRVFPPQETNPEPERDQEKEPKEEVEEGDPKKGASYACYGDRCYSRFDSADLDHTHDEYQYRDPYTDPSFPSGFNKDQYRPPFYFLDLRQLPPQDQLAPHFKAIELMSERKGRYGLYSAIALDRIEDMRQELGHPMIINSGYRSPAYNDRLRGSATWSRHTYGDAIDFYSPTASLKELARLCVKHGAGFYQVYSSHVHCDWRNDPQDPNFFLPEVPQPDKAEAPKQNLDDVISAVEEMSEIQLNVGRLEKSPWLELDVETYQEDPGQLLTEWVAYLPNGRRVESQAPRLRLPKLEGPYEVHVRVGGHTKVKKIFSHFEK